MKKTMMFLLTAAFLLGSYSFAHADSINFSLSAPIQTVTPGGVVTFTATVEASASNTGTIYVNAYNSDFFGPGTMNDDSFYNTFYVNTFTPGTIETDDFFSITLPSNIMLDVYRGNLQIYGGTDQFADDLLGTVDFAVNVENALPTPPTAVTPEPSSLLLLFTGVLPVIGLTKLGKQSSIWPKGTARSTLDCATSRARSTVANSWVAVEGQDVVPFEVCYWVCCSRG